MQKSTEVKNKRIGIGKEEKEREKNIKQGRKIRRSA